MSYFALTILYYGISLPATVWIVSIEQRMAKALLWWTLIVIGPGAFGLLLGVATQRGWLRWIAIKLGLRVVHDTPTSWDWRFGDCHVAHFIMVTLTDGTIVSGIFGTGSFASTDPVERDIYIQELMDVDDDGTWTYRLPPEGILILAKEIRYIEFKGEL